MPEEKEIGKIVHYYTKLGVAIIELTEPLKTGETIRIKGATTDFTHTVDSMQMEHAPIEEAAAGQSIGIKIPEHAREGDVVYKAE